MAETTPPAPPHRLPDVDILDRGDAIVLRADLPGVGAESIDVRCENGVLRIAGTAEDVGPEGGDVLLREFLPTGYYREFTVGEGIDPGGITAEYQDGVLTVRLPKSGSARPRRISVGRP